MNEFREGVIFACKKLSKNKEEFKRNVKKATNYTDSGFDDCDYSQSLFKSFKK